MRVRLAGGVYIRHCGGESVVLCPRTGGYMLLQDAQPFLVQIGNDWCDVEQFVQNVARAFCASASEVREDSLSILEELIRNGFVATDEARNVDGTPAVSDLMASKETSVSDDDSIMDDYIRRHGIPADFHLDLTDACSERCVHCYVPKEQHHFLPYELAKKAIREFRELQGFSVHITGGECMLHPDFERVCELCKSLNINIIIFSNLTCCDARRIAFLREIDPQFINVSLYGMNPREHDAITQLPGSWQKTMDTILACEKAGVHCRIATPLLKINQQAFPELKKFAEAHHMHLIPSADIIAQSDHGCGNLASACSAEEMRCVMQANRELFDRYEGVKMPTCDAKVCDIGVGRLYLNVQGNYYPCDSMHDYVLGNVRENTFDEIWKGEKINYLRGLKNKDFGACASCGNRPWCKVCPAANFNATRNLFTPPPGHCEFTKVVREVYGTMC